MIEVLKYRIYMLFRAGQNNFRTVLWGRNGFSTQAMAMSRHRSGEYRTQACEAPLSTLFGSQIFGHTLGFFLPPYQTNPSCFTPFPSTKGFSQAGPVLLEWWLPLTCPVDVSLWQVPVAPQSISVTPNYILPGVSPLTSCTGTTSAY